MIEAPQSFIVRQECEKVAWQHGFRRIHGEETGWIVFSSTTANGFISLAAAGASGPWYLAIDHPGVIEELDIPTAEIVGPGRARFAFDTLRELYAAMHRVYELAISLPDAPLREFEAKTAGLPRATEAERLVLQRIGQDIFRDRLMDYWQGRCPITGIADPGLLRASHMRPWSACEIDSQRLDVHNGLLLSSLWDAAFDCGLITFDVEGRALPSPQLSAEAAERLGVIEPPSIKLTDEHHTYLAYHRNYVWKAEP